MRCPTLNSSSATAWRNRSKNARPCSSEWRGGHRHIGGEAIEWSLLGVGRLQRPRATVPAVGLEAPPDVDGRELPAFPVLHVPLVLDRLDVQMSSMCSAS